MLILADGAPGLIKAIEQCWPASDRQHCAVHRVRNLLAKLPERGATNASGRPTGRRSMRRSTSATEAATPDAYPRARGGRLHRRRRDMDRTGAPVEWRAAACGIPRPSIRSPTRSRDADAARSRPQRPYGHQSVGGQRPKFRIAPPVVQVSSTSRDSLSVRRAVRHVSRLGERPLQDRRLGWSQEALPAVRRGADTTRRRSSGAARAARRVRGSCSGPRVTRSKRSTPAAAATQCS